MQEFEAASDLASLYGSEKLSRQAANLGETLDYLPSVSTISTGSVTGQPVIRGLSGNRIRVLQDGSGVNYQQFGVRHPPNIDPFLTERIEVVRGVSSILYGSDAFGGAINAISPSIQYAYGDDWFYGGEAVYRYESGNDLHTGSITAHVANANWGLSAGAVHRDSGNLQVPEVDTYQAGVVGQATDLPKYDGELDFTDFEQTNSMIKMGYRFGNAEASLRYEAWRNENNYLLPDGTGIGGNLENDLIQGELKGELSSAWNWKTSYTWSSNLRQGNAAGTELPVKDPAVDIERDSHTLRNEFTYGEVEDRYSGTLGIEGIYEDQESRGRSGLTPGGQIGNLAAFGLGRMKTNKWTYEAGLRFDYRTQEADPSQTADTSLLESRVDPITGDPIEVDLDNSYTVATASLGTVYQINESFALAANASRGFRAPELFELYAAGVHGGVAAIQYGNTDLDEETSLGGDLQARWRSDRLDWTATVYYTAFTDYIYLWDTGATSGSLPIYKIGQSDATLHGGDLSVTFRATDWLTLEGSYEFVRGEFKNGDEVPLLPADQIRLEARLHYDALGPMEAPEFRIGIRHAFAKDAAGAYEPFAQFDDMAFGTASTDAYTLLDLGYSFRYKQLSLDLSVKNACDEDYRDFLDTYKGYALSPGRSFVIQTSLSF
jgi:iron complex outermembrane receptor protein/hemoglobin/transferrin/lactoferrin receptor protein